MPDPTSSPAPAEPPGVSSPAVRPRRSFVRRALRVTLWLVALLLLASGFSLWLVTRPWFIVRTVRPELERRLGGTVQIGDAAFQGSDRVVFTNLALIAPGIEGPAAQVASIGRAVVTVNLARLFTGGLVVRDVDVQDVVIRLSESKSQTGQLNFMNLHPARQEGRATSLPPRVSISNATIEFGTHAEGGYEMLGRRLLAGQMYPTSASDPWYNFELSEIDEDGQGLAERGLFVKGSWNVETNAHRSRIDGLEMDDRIYWMSPRLVRLWWDRMRLEGKVDGVRIEWEPGTPFSMVFDVQNVALTLPLEYGNQWARYRNGRIESVHSRPRMLVESGTIHLSSEALRLENLRGELVSSDSSRNMAGVPYTVSLTIPRLPDIEWDRREQWMDEVLRITPFQMQCRIEEVTLRQRGDESPAIDLPAIIARVLEKFEMNNWTLSSSVTVTRSAVGAGDDGHMAGAMPVTEGQAFIRNATGRYQKFPYQLEDVDAYLRFDNSRIVVEYLTGRGSGQSKFRLAGEIAPPTSDAAVTLRLTGTDVPIDGRLREALHESEQQAFDALFANHAHEASAAAGLLPDKTSLAAAEAERRELRDRLVQQRQAGAAGDDGQRDAQEVARRIARLDRHIEAGAFELGGAVDLDLNIERPMGPHQPTLTSGTIKVKRAGVLYENFPYPLRVGSGTIQWKPEGVTILAGAQGEGLPFIGPGGGRGFISGSIWFPKSDGSVKLRPDLRISADDEQITDALFAAIPEGAGDKARPLSPTQVSPDPRRSTAGELLAGMGLDGAIKCDGTITADGSGAVQWDFGVTMQDCSARPQPGLARALGLPGEVWPSGFALRDISGAARISRDAVTWTDLRGAGDRASVASSGSIGFAGDDRGSEVIIDFAGFPLDPALLNLAPHEQAQRLAQLWERLEPLGVVDARLIHKAVGAAPATTTLAVRPHGIRMLLDDHPTTFDAQQGEIAISRDRIAFNDLRLVVTDKEDRDDGIISIDGTIELAGTGEPLRLDVHWRGGRLESPIILEALQLVGAQREREMARTHSPAGVFDADALITISAARQPARYELSIRPKWIAFDSGGVAVHADIRGGDLALTPDGLAIHGLRGHHGDDEFEIDGHVALGERASADLWLDFTGRLRGKLFSGCVPAVVREGLDTIRFRDGGLTTLADCRVRLEQAPLDSGGRWRAEAAGRLEVRGASFVAGTSFTDVHGSVPFDVLSAPGQPTRLTMNATAERLTTMGQLLIDVRAPMRLSAEGDTLCIDSFSASAGDGAVAGQVQVGVGANEAYEAHVDLVAVPLEGFIGYARGSPRARGAGRERHAPQGDVYASVALWGERNSRQSRRGRGVMRVLGRVAPVPWVLQMMQLVQLTVPFSGSVNFADLDMYLAGDQVVFERIVFESTVGQNATLQLLGEGEMNFDTLDLNTRFRARSGVAVLRDIFGGLSDRLYGIQVTGTLRNPQARLVAAPAVQQP